MHGIGRPQIIDHHPQTPFGKDWVSRFMNRHPKHLTRKHKRLSAERKNAYEEEGGRKIYETFQRNVQEKGNTDNDIWDIGRDGFSNWLENNPLRGYNK